MRQFGFVAMLSAMALGTVSLGTIKVAVQDSGFTSTAPAARTSLTVP